MYVCVCAYVVKLFPSDGPAPQLAGISKSILCPWRIWWDVFLVLFLHYREKVAGKNTLF